MVFRRLLRWVAFLFAGEWLIANFLIGIDHFLNTYTVQVFERLVSVGLGRFMECRGVLPTTQFAYRNGLVTCNAHVCVAHTLQSALEKGQEARIVQIDFRAALTGSTIRGFSSSSVMWELEVQYCLF